VLACRSVQRGQTLATSLTAAAVAEGVAQPRVEVEQLDLASLDSVRAFAKAWNARAQPLACLVNNAGIFDMGARAPGRGDHGFEDHWLTNFVVRDAAFLFFA
jgi:short-subunit dehydrogenase